MKKLLAVIICLCLAAALPLGLSAENEKGTKSFRDIHADGLKLLRKAEDEYRASSGWTQQLQDEADIALANIYASLYGGYAREDGREAVRVVDAEFEKRGFSTVAVKEYVKPLYYSNIVKWASDRSLTLEETYNGKTAYVVGFADVGAQPGDIYSIFHGVLVGGQGSYTTASSGMGVEFFDDLRFFAVKAYELLKTSELDLGKTTARYFYIVDYTSGYEFTDGKSTYYLVFGEFGSIPRLDGSGGGNPSHTDRTSVPESESWRLLELFTKEDMAEYVAGFDVSRYDKDVGLIRIITVGDDGESVNTGTGNGTTLWAVIATGGLVLAVGSLVIFRKPRAAE